MHFRQFYLGCLAHASYIIGSGTEAAVVDPQRDTEIYMEQAKAHGLTIKHVIETHCHADFVSGRVGTSRVGRPDRGKDLFWGSSRSKVRFRARARRRRNRYGRRDVALS